MELFRTRIHCPAEQFRIAVRERFLYTLIDNCVCTVRPGRDHSRQPGRMRRKSADKEQTREHTGILQEEKQ